MTNNVSHPKQQGPFPALGSGEINSVLSQQAPRVPSYPYVVETQPSVRKQTPRLSQVRPSHLPRQPANSLPPSNLRHMQDPRKMDQIALEVSDGSSDTSQPSRKKLKKDPASAPTPPQSSPKLPAGARSSGGTPPLIDVIPSGPRGDTTIKLSLPTQTAPGPSTAATPKKTILLRVHSLFLKLHSPFFRDLLSPENTGAVGVEPVFTEMSPWTLPADWDAAAFLDWCIMVCGMSSVYDVVGDRGKDPYTVKQQGHTKPGRDGSREAHTKQPAKSADGGKTGRFPRVVALAEKLGCSRSMKHHCGMPLWRYFGPRGEADEEGLSGRGLSVLDAIGIAYVVDDETLFRRSTEYALVNFGKNQWETNLSGGLEHIVPKSIIGDIKAKRRTTLAALEKDAYKSITAIHNKVMSLEPCNSATEKLATYTLQMCHVKDGAYDLDATPMSLADVWDGLETAAEALPETTKKCSKTCEGGCVVDMREILSKAIEDSKDCIEGLCLRCVKERVKADGDGAVLCEHDVED